MLISSEVPQEDKKLIDDIWKSILDAMETSNVRDGMEICKEVLGQMGNGHINLYPSKIKGPCHSVAVFLSLRFLKKNFSLYLIMQNFIQHMLGTCYQHTKKALVYTDTWDPTIYEPWKTCIERIRQEGAKVYFMLVNPDNSYTILNA